MWQSRGGRARQNSEIHTMSPAGNRRVPENPDCSQLDWGPEAQNRQGNLAGDRERSRINARNATGPEKMRVKKHILQMDPTAFCRLKRSVDRRSATLSVKIAPDVREYEVRRPEPPRARWKPEQRVVGRPEPPPLSSNPISWTARAVARSSGLSHFRLAFVPRRRGASVGGNLIVARRSGANRNCQEKHGGSRKAEK